MSDDFDEFFDAMNGTKPKSDSHVVKKDKIVSELNIILLLIANRLNNFDRSLSALRPDILKKINAYFVNNRDALGIKKFFYHSVSELYTNTVAGMIEIHWVDSGPRGLLMWSIIRKNGLHTANVFWKKEES